MTGRPRPRVGIFGLTGCAGDQLQILNCEEQLIRLATELHIVDWVMAMSVNDHETPLDIGFVEGVVATERDLEDLKRIRERCACLVALGTCAVWGGLPAMRNTLPPEVLLDETHDSDVHTPSIAEARPATHFVPFEVELPGCPIERDEFLRLVASLLVGSVPEFPPFPVCWECKIRENPCRVLDNHEVCCGAMTRSGCGARCPSLGVACAGCRGPLEEPNYDANATMFSDRGMSWLEVGRRMRIFSAPVWMRIGLEGEVADGD